MLFHVAVSDAIRDPLIAEYLDQPIENNRGVVAANRSDYTAPGQPDPGVFDQRWRTRCLADAPDQLDRAVTVRSPSYR